MIASTDKSAFRTLLEDLLSRNPDTDAEGEEAEEGMVPPGRSVVEGLVKASEKGLPPCPACGQWSMQRDSSKKRTVLRGLRRNHVIDSIATSPSATVAVMRNRTGRFGRRE